MSKKLEKFRVDFKDADNNYISAEVQANKIIEEVKNRLGNGVKGVAITYSANNLQAAKIYEGYRDNIFNSGITGANQAVVFGIIQKEIVEKNLQNQVHILPVATSIRGGMDTPDNMATKEMADRDVENMARHLGANWDVLGLQNQETYEDDTFAIGGGVSENWLEHEETQGKYVAEVMAELANGDIRESLQQAYAKGENQGVEQIPDLPSAELNDKAEKEDIYNSKLYPALKITNETENGYSLKNDDKELLTTSSKVEDGKPRISITCKEKNDEAINITLQTVQMNAKNLGIKHPKINIQDIDNPEHALKISEAAKKMGFKVVIKDETLKKIK